MNQVFAAAGRQRNGRKFSSNITKSGLTQKVFAAKRH